MKPYLVQHGAEIINAIWKDYLNIQSTRSVCLDVTMSECHYLYDWTYNNCVMFLYNGMPWLLKDLTPLGSPPGLYLNQDSGPKGYQQTGGLGPNESFWPKDVNRRCFILIG